MTPPLSKHLNAYYQNCGGIRSKLANIRLNLAQSDYDIVLLTETWLQAGVFDSEVVPNNFNIFRRDRDTSTSHKKDGGGTLIAINKRIPAIRRAEWESKTSEEVIISIPMKNCNIIIGAVYIPPSSLPETYNELCCKWEQIYADNPNSIICIIGDFNVPSLIWRPVQGVQWLEVSETPNDVCRRVSELIEFLNLNQYNHFYNENHTLLDLLLSTSECQVLAPEALLSNVVPHHPPFQFHIEFHPNISLPVRHTPKYNFYKANYELIRKELLEINWQDELDPRSTDEALDRFYDILFNIIDKYVPYKIKKCPRYPSWFSRSLISTFKRKAKVWSKWKIYNCLADYREFSLLRSRCKRMIRECFRSHVKETENNIKSNIKSFWSYVHSLKKNCSDYPAEMTYNNEIAKNAADIGELFSKFFSSVFEEPSCSTIDLNSLDCSPSATPIANIQITEPQILKKINAIDISKGAGPDGIKPIFIKNVGSCIALPLKIIFNKSLSDGTFPKRWKLSYVTPIHKSGSKSMVEKYRPISVQSCFSKLLESLVHDVVYSLVEKNITPQQHGFMKKKSTISNLLIYSNFIFQALDEKKQVDAIYTDFRKAFDKVDHNLLLQKLAFNGIRGTLLSWFKSYLQDRTQIVIINGFESQPTAVPSGVIQGSILGPLQYLFFINDISRCFQNCEFKMFADDLKIYKIINSLSDCELVQDDLNRFQDYCIKNKLHLAHDKCLHISFTKKQKHKINYNYNIGTNPVEKVSKIRDLGILLDQKLNLSEHIEEIVCRAYRMMGFVLRTAKPFKRKESYLLLYKTLVRPYLEYGSVIWNPLYNKYIKKLELIQKKFLRALHFRLTRSRKSYKDLLIEYNITSLSDRRIITDALTLYNIFHNNINCPELLHQIKIRVPNRTTRNKNKSTFSIPNCSTNSGVRAPLRRICKTYNESLLDADIFGDSKKSFRKNILSILIKSAPMQPM